MPEPVYEWVPYEMVDQWERNPNVHPEQQVTEIAESIRAFGFVAPCVVWAGRNRLVAGHGRLAAMRLICEEGYDYVDASGAILHRDPEPDFCPRGAPSPGHVSLVRYDFASEAEADAYSMADNQLAKSAEMSPDMVRDLLKGVSADADFDALHAIGFPHDLLAAMIEEEHADLASTADRAPAQEPAPESVAEEEDSGKPDDAMVTLSIAMTVAERARCNGVLDLAKRVSGAKTSREAILVALAQFEHAHGAK